MLKKLEGFNSAHLLFCALLSLTCLNNSALAASPENEKAANKSAKKTEAVVVSANRYSTAASKVSSAVTVITAEDIARQQVRHVHDVLRTVPYLDVISSGGQGGNVSIFIRGANSDHTLVVVDGIEINNPATTNRTANLSNLTVDNIERIEVLRGNQSMLYGSDALGGVIAIYTKSGSEQAQSSLDLSGGAYNTFRSIAQTSGKQSDFSYALSAGYEESDGISAAAKSDGNSERDGYYDASFSGKVSAELSDTVQANLISRYTQGKADLDNLGGVGGDDLNRRLNSEQVLVRAEAITSIFNPQLTQTFGVSWADQDVEDRNDPDALSADFLRSDFDGTLTKFDLLSRWEPSSMFTGLLGLETEQEKASSSSFSDGAFGPFVDEFPGQDMRTNSVFLDGVWSAQDWLTINSGGRYDDNSVSGSEATYRAGPVVCLNDCESRLSASIGTGYKAPSLFQLSSSFGNSQLAAEESFNWELGAEQQLFDEQLSTGVTFFRNEIDNLVTFDSQTFVFENINKARIYGFEVFALLDINDTWSWRNDYAYTDARDSGTAEFLLRRARNKVSSEISKSFLDKRADVSLRITGYDGRFDNDFSQFPAQRVQLAGYAVVDLNASFSFNDWLEIYGRIENLLDKEYQEVLGFGTPGVAAYAGIRATL